MAGVTDQSEFYIVDYRDTEQWMKLPFFPESISDDKETTWQSEVFPGASHPLYQWVSGGTRPISFEAKLYKESRIPGEPNVDEQISFLRKYLYPRYEKSQENQFNVKPPPLVKLCFPTRHGVTPRPSPGKKERSRNEGGSLTNIINAIMQQANVTQESWFEDGELRSATVSLTFEEIVQVDGRITFHGFGDFDQTSGEQLKRR